MKRLHLVFLVASSGVVGCVRYRAAPLDPSGLAAVYSARQLNDSALRHFMTSAGTEAPDSEWHPRDLSLVALYFHPDLDLARATWHEAVAAERTAGARPPLSADATVNRAARPDEGKTTSWSVSLGAGLTLETGGKRGARLARARAATLAARLRLETAAWRVAEDAANAGLDAASADRDLQRAGAEQATVGRVLALLQARYAQGAASLTELARAEGDLQAATVSVLSAQRKRTAARAELARAVGLPVARVDSLSIALGATSGCAILDSVAAPALERRALHTRADLGTELAAYAEVEGALRVAVAEQYPDLSFGPGIGWEQGIGRWSLGLALPKVLLNRNRGPIAEAEARREGMAVRFEEVQQNVLREVASGAAECQGARLEMTQADTLFRGAAHRLTLAQAAYQRGETGETEVAFARLGLVRAQHTRDLAIRRLAGAQLGLERAVGAWLGPSAPRWPDLTQPARPALPEP